MREGQEEQVCDSIQFIASDWSKPDSGGRSNTIFEQEELYRQIFETMERSAATKVLIERQRGILGKHTPVVRW